MKLIRDIINEKRSNGRMAASDSEVAHGSDREKTKPLLLETPIHTPNRSADLEEDRLMAEAHSFAQETPEPSAAQDEEFDPTASADFFGQTTFDENEYASDEGDEEEYEAEYGTETDIGADLEFDDDEDYDDDDYEPEFDADALEAEFDLDDFAPRREFEAVASFDDGTDPFDRLDAAHDQSQKSMQSPSPLKRAEPLQTVEAETSSDIAVDPWQSAQSAPEQPVAVEQSLAAVPASPEPQKPAEIIEEQLTAVGDANSEEPVDMPAPAVGRASNRTGRVKTRLLGFSAGAMETEDPFEKAESKSDGSFPVGWLVVVSEMGRGLSYSLHDGVSKIGRGADQTVSLNFGDNSISRENHISIAYDAEQNKFFIGHSGKTNLVRVNKMPLLSTQELFSNDFIRLGETTLRFIAFCQDDFNWNEQAAPEKAVRHA